LIVTYSQCEENKNYSNIVILFFKFTGSEPYDTEGESNKDEKKANNNSNNNDEGDDEDNEAPPPKRSPTNPPPSPTKTKPKKATGINQEGDNEANDKKLNEKERPPPKKASSATDESAKKRPTKPEPIPDLAPPQVVQQRPSANQNSPQVDATNQKKKPSGSLPSPPNIFNNQFKEPLFAEKNSNNNGGDGGNSDLGFFEGAQENFPDIADFGLSWEPQKVARSRSKRAAVTRIVLKNPFYYRDERRKQRASRGSGNRAPPPPPPRQVAPVGDRRSAQGPTGFWDNTEFDSDFFNGGSPGPVSPSSGSGYSSSSYEDFSPPATPLVSPVQKYAAEIQPTQYQKPARLSYSLPAQVLINRL
jgi:hypothetical protein